MGGEGGWVRWGGVAPARQRGDLRLSNGRGVIAREGYVAHV